MSLAAETFGDVSADRVDGIFGLRLRLQIASECRPAGQLQRFNAEFVGQLPHCQLGEMTRAAHDAMDCMPDAVHVVESFQRQTTKHGKICEQPAGQNWQIPPTRPAHRNNTRSCSRRHAPAEIAPAREVAIAPTRASPDRTDPRSRHRTDTRQTRSHRQAKSRSHRTRAREDRTDKRSRDRTDKRENDCTDKPSGDRTDKRQPRLHRQAKSRSHRHAPGEDRTDKRSRDRTDQRSRDQRSLAGRK